MPPGQMFFDQKRRSQNIFKNFDKKLFENFGTFNTLREDNKLRLPFFNFIAYL
jgi:hypothetical protein